MNLCIDVGNTKAKLGVYNSNGELQAFFREDNVSITVLDKVLKQFPIQHAIISSVRAAQDELIDYLSAQLETVIQLSHNIKVPIVKDYWTPETLGNDRLAVAVGAAFLYPNEHVLIVDAGTCITYDFITADKHYEGGSILPGIEMRFKALNHFTAKLPLVKQVVLTDFIGKSTETSIQTGIMQGVLHELRGFKSQYQQKYGNIRLVITGGDTSYFESQLKNEIFAQPNLVLIGLNAILTYNTGNNR